MRQNPLAALLFLKIISKLFRNYFCCFIICLLFFISFLFFSLSYQTWKNFRNFLVNLGKILEISSLILEIDILSINTRLLDKDVYNVVQDFWIKMSIM